MTADFWSPDPDPAGPVEQARIEATRRGVAACRAVLLAEGSGRDAPVKPLAGSPGHEDALSGLRVTPRPLRLRSDPPGRSGVAA